MAFDYGRMEPRADANGGKEHAPSPILVTKMSVDGYITADVLPCKGVGHPHCVPMLVRAAVGSGCNEICLR